MQLYNNDTISWSPNVIISDSIKDKLLYTIPKKTILTGELDAEINFVSKNSNQSGSGTVTLTSDTCTDIIIPVTIEPSDGGGDFLNRVLFNYDNYPVTNTHVLLLGLFAGIIIRLSVKKIAPGTTLLLVFGTPVVFDIVMNLLF